MYKRTFEGSPNEDGITLHQAPRKQGTEKGTDWAKVLTEALSQISDVTQSSVRGRQLKPENIPSRR